MISTVFLLYSYEYVFKHIFGELRGNAAEICSNSKSGFTHYYMRRIISKSGLGLPSIVALVMTIDKSWTTISNRNSDEFLDGLFAFIKHCEPLLHPITQKIRCPCSRCCNRDDKFVTLKTLEVHISSHGFDQHYTAWKYHGEPTLLLPLPVPYLPEHIDMDAFFEDISANNVPTQTTGPQPAQTTGPNNEFEELLSRSTQKLYPGCDMTTLEFTTEISHIKALHKITDVGFNKLALLQKDNDKSKDYAKGKARLGNFESSKGVVVKKTKREVGEASSKDDVETRFNRLGRNDDGLPEEEPDKFQVFRSVCKPTGRMKETRLTTDVMQAVVWLYYKNSPEVDAESWLTEEYDSSIFILNISFSMIILISCNLSQRLADTWERVFPACLIHKRSLNHFGLDGEMYYGQLEEIMELTYIGHRKVVLFRCKWEFHKNNQYILATQVTQVFYLQDLARQPRGWKVVEHVYHRDVAESDQDVIHGSSSSHVTLSVGLTNLEHTDLSINAQSTEVDAPPVNDDNANANEDGCLDDDEVNPSTNVEEVLSSDDSDDDN
ncbi:zinc finger, CCHC-type containing protein [Tanacetum coccineum]